MVISDNYTKGWSYIEKIVCIFCSCRGTAHNQYMNESKGNYSTLESIKINTKFGIEDYKLYPSWFEKTI